MLLEIPDILSSEEAVHFRERLLAAEWHDGRATAGHHSAAVKRNRQIHWQDPVAHDLGRAIVARLEANPMFLSAALPRSILPPLFNRYGVGETYGDHVDGAIRAIEGGAERMRTDLSFTLVLSEAAEYEGGELVVQDLFGTRTARPAAGTLILYPSSSVHRVEAVRHGERLAAFGWVQSLVRDEGERRLLFELDVAIQQLRAAPGADEAGMASLLNVYHNLLRRWATP